MTNARRYKMAVWILSIVIVIQGIFIFVLTRPKKVPRVPRVAVAIKGKIAIVLDDWGYNLNNLEIVEQIKYPLTMSVLPNLSYSKAIAGELHRRGFETILHLPMEPEPRERLRLEKNTIMTSMDGLRIKSILTQDLNEAPYIKGVSNHMGSKATQDSKVMEAVFGELKKRKLYFLDSFVSGESVAFELAHKMNVGFARRDIFLDNTSDPAYIRAQVNKLKLRAGVYGQAIGIGHDRKNTLEVLREMMPQIAKEGYKFVFVSEQVR